MVLMVVSAVTIIAPSLPVPLGRRPQALLAHCSAAAQVWPHWPQFCASAVRSTHAVPQAVMVPLQEQVPAWQVWAAPQALVQLPQWLLSLLTSMQVLPHIMVPPAQPQTPAVQLRPAAHTLPQPPQLLASVLTLTQALPHWVVPLMHALLQLPAEHTCPDVQALPQAPQFAGSDCGSTHALPHAFCVSLQLGPEGLQATSRAPRRPRMIP